jgi:hypothetical protein
MHADNTDYKHAELTEQIIRLKKSMKMPFANVYSNPG